MFIKIFKITLFFILFVSLETSAVAQNKNITKQGYVYGGKVTTRPEATTVPPPVVIPPTPIPVGSMSFTNISDSIFPPYSNNTIVANGGNVFEADLLHLDNDYCYDASILEHGGQERLIMYKQNISSGVCLGTYSYWQTIDAGASPRLTSSISSIDADNDGDFDIVGADADSNPPGVLINNGSGVFTRGEWVHYSEARRGGGHLLYNKDGIPDTVSIKLDAMTSGQSYVELFDLLVNPTSGNKVYDGGLPGIASYTEWSAKWGGVVLADFNNDSYIDMVNPVRGFSYVHKGFSGQTPLGFNTIFNTFPTVNPSLTTIEPWRDPALSNVLDCGMSYNGYSLAACGDSPNIHSGGNHRRLIDYDNDGDFDIFVLKLNKSGNGLDQPNTDVGDTARAYVLQNDGAGVFTIAPNAAGIGALSLTTSTYGTSYSGSQVADYDNNGWTDILVGTTSSVTGGGFYCSFLMNQGGIFTQKQLLNCTPNNDYLSPYTGNPYKSVQEIIDYDADGWMDIVSTKGGGDLGDGTTRPYREGILVFKNTTVSTNKWIKFYARGAQNKQGLNTVFTIYRAGTSQIIATRMVQKGGMLNDVEVHAGLGTESFVDVKVKYPNDGGIYTYRNLSANNEYVVFSDGSIISDWKQGTSLPATPPSETVVSLVVTPQSGVVGANELVTTSIPLPPNVISSSSQVRVFNDSNVEIPTFTKKTIDWQKSFKSPRAVKIQFYFNASAGSKTYSVKLGKASTLTSLSEQPIANGLRASTAVADKDGVFEPRVLALLPASYLVTSKITSPYSVPSSNTYDNVMWPAIAAVIPVYPFAGAESSCFAWEYDRASTIYKAALRHGTSAIWLEAFRSGRWYLANIKRTGTTATGSSNERGNLLCQVGQSNGKYAYPEALLLHVALTGDDDIITTISNGTATPDTPASLAKAMADFVWTQPSGTPYAGSKEPYDAVDDTYTERAAGFRLASNMFAYEMSGDSTYLTRTNTVLTNILNHVNTANPDSFSLDGLWRHSWDKHEGNAYGTLTFAWDRRASPWMTPTLVGYLWDAYHSGLVPSFESQLSTTIRNAGRGITKFGYIDSYGYNQTSNGFSMFVNLIPNSTYSADCNSSSGLLRDGASPLYATLNTVDVNTVPDKATLDTLNNGETLYSAQTEHNPQMFGLLAMARFFETDSTEITRIDSYITKNETIFFPNCASYLADRIDNNTSATRKLNWSFHINPMGTWLWVKTEKGIP
jgi:hypothetical protein